MNPVLTIVWISFLVESVAHAADWPMYRGNPALTGVAQGTLPDKPVLLWTFKTQGPIKSSAALSGGRVFVGSDDGNVYALDIKTGHKLWAARTGGPVESSPLVLGGRVFVGSSDACLYGFDAGTGRKIWKYVTGDKILGAPNWFAQPLTRPLDTHPPTGGEREEVKGASKTNILIGSYDFKLHCVDAASGSSNWVYESGNYINGSPAVANSQAVFGGCDAVLHVISLTNGEQLAEVEAGAYVAGSAALAGGRAYFGHFENEFRCVDLKLATNVWSFRDRNFPYFSSPAVTEDRVLFGGRDKMLHCLRRDDGRQMWNFATLGKVDSSPVVCGDKVVIGSDDGRVYLLRLNDGKELWSYEIGQAIESSPAVAEEKFVIGGDDGIVYCFGKDQK